MSPTSSYEPVHHQLTVDSSSAAAGDHDFDRFSSSSKPDPVAVLPVSSSISSRHKGHQQEQLLNRAADQWSSQSSSQSTTVLSSSAQKGQQSSASPGEYCLFSSQSLSLHSSGKSLTSTADDFSQQQKQQQQYLYSLPPYFSLR